MSNSMTITPADPTALKAVMQAKLPAAPDKARAAQDLFKLAAAREAAGPGNADRKELRHAVVELRTDRERLERGHRPLDPYDVLENGVAIARTITAALPYLGAVAGSPGIAKGTALRVAVDSALDVLDRGLAIPAVKDLIAGHRALNGSDSVADLTDAWSGMLDRAVDRIAEHMMAEGPDGPTTKAFADLFPAVSGPSTDDFQPAAGAVVRSNADIFGQYTDLIIVQADNSVVIKDIDSLRHSIDSSLTQVSQHIVNGFGTVKDELRIVHEEQKLMAAGQDGILALLNRQAEKEEKQRRAEEASGRAVARMTAACSAAEGAVAGAAGVASLLGDKRLSSEITRFGAGAVQVGKSVVTFTNAVSELSKGLSTLSALGTAAATGNLIGAVAGFAGLFAPSGPQPEQVILDEIETLRQGLSGLQEELREGPGPHRPSTQLHLHGYHGRPRRNSQYYRCDLRKRSRSTLEAR